MHFTRVSAAFAHARGDVCCFLPYPGYTIFATDSSISLLAYCTPRRFRLPFFCWCFYGSANACTTCRALHTAYGTWRPTLPSAFSPPFCRG